MNLNSVTKLYVHLKPEERVPLIIAAQARGDAAELERLIESAPRLSCSVADFSDLEQHFLFLSLVARIELLDLAARMQDALAAGESLFDMQGDEFDEQLDADAEQWHRVAKAIGFLFKVRLAGWRLFCEQLLIDADGYWSGLSGTEVLTRAEQRAAITTFDLEGMTDFIRGKVEASKLPTAESVAAAWQRQVS